MTIDFRLRRSSWAVASVGSASTGPCADVMVGPLESKPSRRAATQGPATFAGGASIGLLTSLRRGWARLVAPREQDAASLARRFESLMPNLAAEIRQVAASSPSDDGPGRR